MFFFFYKKLDSCARAGLVGNIGKFAEKSVKILGDIFGDFLGSSGFSVRFFSDLSVLHRYFADISPIFGDIPVDR